MTVVIAFCTMVSVIFNFKVIFYNLNHQASIIKTLVYYAVINRLVFFLTLVRFQAHDATPLMKDLTVQVALQTTEHKLVQVSDYVNDINITPLAMVLR
jgi:hypothetical protein